VSSVLFLYWTTVTPEFYVSSEGLSAISAQVKVKHDENGVQIIMQYARLLHELTCEATLEHLRTDPSTRNSRGVQKPIISCATKLRLLKRPVG
jgi:hypothetical protein